MKRLIGNTPFLAIDDQCKGQPGRIYAKSENLNMTGSVKDGMALPILRRTCERETIALIVIVHMEVFGEIVPVNDGDSIRMAQALARQLGLGVGISSGANFLGAVQKQVEAVPRPRRAGGVDLRTRS